MAYHFRGDRNRFSEYKTPSLADRFLAKVDKTETCWNWTGYSPSKRMGYGAIIVNGERILTHRLAYKMLYGEIPKDMYVLHRCDNPKCVRPAHLWLGTKGDNNRDRDEKGRTVRLRGERHPGCKITEELARQIKTRLKNGEAPKEIYHDLEIQKDAVYRIKYGTAWNHIVV